MHWSSNMTCSAKKLLINENLSSALHIAYHFMRKKHLSCTWALLLNLHLATFSHWEWRFSASVALHSLHLLSYTKHSISVLRSSKLVILCIEALTWLALQKKLLIHENLSSALHIAFHFMRKKHLSCTWALLLNLHLATFSHWEWRFSASVALHSLHLLSYTKHSISVLGRSKLVILCIEALTWLALQKSS